jgi:hypothetical protein
MTLTPNDRLAQHVVELAQAFGVMLQVTHSLLPHEAGAGYPKEDKHLPPPQRRKLVLIAPVRDETTYAVALHELGHCLHPLGSCGSTEGSLEMRLTNRYSTLRDIRLQLLEEESAWEWARHYALEWTDVMTYVQTISTESYRRTARRFGVRT